MQRKAYVSCLCKVIRITANNVSGVLSTMVHITSIIQGKLVNGGE